MKTEIFQTKVHFPKAGSDINTECGEMFHRVMHGDAEVMVFNDILIIMADKKDVHYIDVLDTEFGGLGKKYAMRPDLMVDKPSDKKVEVKSDAV